MTDLDLTIEGADVLRTVGRYAVVREVGRGGTAIVYLARQTDLGRDVALKELAAFHAAKPKVVERFLRESRVTGGLNHPNVVTVHEYLEHDGTAYIAMEYFERGSLRPLVSSLTLPQIAGVLDGVLAGLAHAESRGVVHRDLKPENLMVTTDGGIKITDFGIAKALQSSAGGSLTAPGTTVGTPEYMAPEQALGDGIGPLTDLYAVGVIAYELLAGEVPFPGTEMPLVTLLRHVNEPIRPLRSVALAVDPSLSDWVERMLAKEPRERPGGAAEAREQLEETILGVLGPRWRREARLPEPEAPDGLAELTTPRVNVPARRAASSTTDAIVQPLTRERRRPLRRRTAWFLGIPVAVGLAGAIAVPALRDDAAPATTPTPRAHVVADYVPTPAEQVSLAVSGPYLLVSDPRGRVVQLDRSPLRVSRVLRDPAGPTSSAAHNGRVYVADGDALTVRGPSTLAPIRASALPRGAVLGGGTSGALVVAAPSAKGHARLCTVQDGVRLAPCARIGFHPSGVASSLSGGLIAAADPSRERIVFFRRTGNRLETAGSPVAVGREPHGEPRFFGEKLYVPIERGIAVVDVAGRRRAAIIELPVSPSSLWISAGGRLLAPLPAIDRVALLDTARPGARPALVAVGDKPVAVTGAGDVAFVAAHGSRRVTRLDARSGRRSGSIRVDALGAERPRRTVLRRVTARPLIDKTVVTFRLIGSGLARDGIVVRDGDLRDGAAMLELWQGGIATARRLQALTDLTARIGRAPGRLTVRLTAAPGTFGTVRVRRGSGKALVVELTRPRRITLPPPPTVSPQPPAAGPTGRVQNPPPPAPPPPPTPPSDCCVTG